MVRWSLLCGCGLVQEHPDPLVQAEAIACLQQMHMFAPRHVNLSTLVPMLVVSKDAFYVILLFNQSLKLLLVVHHSFWLLKDFTINNVNKPLLCYSSYFFILSLCTIEEVEL